MRSILRFLSGFVLGSVVGAAVATLLAPSSGDDLRSQIRGEVDRIQLEVKQAATDRRVEMERQLSALRAPRQS